MVEKTVGALLEENTELRHRLRESEEILTALRAGEVDAITVQTKLGVGVFTLKGAEQPYREMVETMSEGAVTIGADGLIIYCNQRFADMLQLDLASVIGTRLVAHFVERDRAAITAALSNKRGDITRITTEMSGGKKSIPVTMAIRADASSHLVLVVSDMTEISEAQEEVARSSTLLDNI